MKPTIAAAELYNLIRKGRAWGNGWRVVQFFDTGGRSIVRDFGEDEAAARAYAAELNVPKPLLASTRHEDCDCPSCLPHTY